MGPGLSALPTLVMLAWQPSSSIASTEAVGAACVAALYSPWDVQEPAGPPLTGAREDDQSHWHLCSHQLTATSVRRMLSCTIVPCCGRRQ